MIKVARVILLSVATLIIITLLLNCAGGKEEIVTDYTEYYHRGVEAFQKRKWEKAIENFKMLILNLPGSEFADDSQFYIGECYFSKKEYLLAISEYQQLIERYPFSNYVEDAYYKAALSYYKLSPKYQLDQNYTLNALRNFQNFSDAFPDSKYRGEVENKIKEIRDRLARKLYESGRLYKKLDRWESAIIYYDAVLEQYYDTPWAIEAELDKMYCYLKLREFEKYEKMLAEFKGKNNPNISHSDSLRVQRRVEHLERLYRSEIEKSRDK